MKNNVYLEYVDSYDIINLQKVVADLFLPYLNSNVLHSKMRVMLKVDLSSHASPDEAKITHPAVIRAIVNVLSKHNIKCVIVDSPYKKYTIENLDEVYFTSGLLEMANLTDCELNRNLKTITYELPNAVKMKSVTLLEEIEKVDAIINVSKLKFDKNIGILGATSNLLGLVPGELKTTLKNRCEKVKDYNAMLLDIYSVVKDKLVLNVLDGIVSLEADGTPRMASLVAVADSCFSLDACLNDIFQLKHENSIIQQASSRDECDLNKLYKTYGEKPEKFVIEDINLTEISQDTLLFEKEKGRKKFLKANQERVEIKDKKCKGCSICSRICPTGAILMKYDKNGELYAHIDYDKCIYCHKCYVACPYRVVEIKTPSKYKKLQKEIKKQN